ncbi:putative Integral membrane sensor signal transduction histidine kinase [metagenome]|uniref:histidine kinase n=1 Tax=metagenome TaxID=256318 RepID=A0A2P2C7K8_9ZZZZ
MSQSAARFLVAAVVAVTVAAEVAAVAFAVGVVPVDQPALYAVTALVQVAAGAVIVWNFPRHPIGWLLVAIAMTQAPFDAALSYGRHGYAEGWPGARYAEIVSLSSWPAGSLAIILLFLMFPDGRFLSPRWWWVVAAWAVGATLLIPGWILNPRLGDDLSAGVNPLAIDASWVEPVFAVGMTFIGTSLVASVLALVMRFRRSHGVERQQLKWVLLAAAILAVALPATAALWSVWPPIRYAPALALTFLPLAVCVAIVRHHLYDIDLVISRTVAYGAITGVLGAAYAGIVLAAGAFVASPVAAAAAAAVVATAFWPLRTWIQDRVDRRFRRARYESRRVMADFADLLRRGEADADGIEEALRTAVGDGDLALGFRLEGTTYDVSGRPRELTPAPGRRVASVDTGHHVVTLVCHRGTDDRLVADVLDAGRLALEIAALQMELRRRLEELDSSRARIVAVADEERRRLARDLHDGAQQRLVSIGLDLRHAQHTLNGSAPPEVDRTLDAAVAELGNAIDDLRELASGLRPASLDQGLASALRELATRSPVPVVVRGAPERFATEVEVAAYFIAAEGLTNAVKHASANSVVLTFVREQGQLVLTVADDGTGGADARRGSGLLGLIDRARAHGGSLTIDSTPSVGTRLLARLPCE